jgi:hypothetical protein
MINLSCLVQDTKLKDDVLQFIETVALKGIAKGTNVSFASVYKDMRENGMEIDYQSAGELYKEVAMSMRRKYGNKIKLDNNKTVNDATGRSILTSVKNLTKKLKMKREITDSPSVTVARSMVETLKPITTPEKSTKKELEGALKKAATAYLNKRGQQVSQKATTLEILQNALKLDGVGIENVKGDLVGLADLFEELKGQVTGITQLLEKQKKGKNNAEIDAKIAEWESLTENLISGAYTLALSSQEKRTVVRDLLKVKYGKDVTVNGQVKRVLNWNELFSSQVPFEQIVSDELYANGFDDVSVTKITQALQAEYDDIRASAHWQNLNTRSAQAAVNDANFLQRVANEVAISKGYFTTEAGGKKVPDFTRYDLESGKTQDQLKDEIRNDIQTNNSASEYRQITSKLAQQNNPRKSVSKSDVQRLIDLRKIHGFDDKFNAKALGVLGLTPDQEQALVDIEELTKKAEAIIADNRFSKESLGLIQADINKAVTEAYKGKSRTLDIAMVFEWAMRNRNSYRVLGIYNAVENTLSGINQILLNVGSDPKIAIKEMKLILKAISNTAQGGASYGGTETTEILYENRLDGSKGVIYNAKVVMSYIPNLVLGAIDSAAVLHTQQTFLMRSFLNHEQGRIEAEMKKSKGGADLTSAEKNDAKKKALDNITNELYDEAKFEKALQDAERNLRTIKDNPTKAEIYIEAKTLIVKNLENIDNNLYTVDRIESMLKASRAAALRATGKKSEFKGLDNLNREESKAIKDEMKAGRYGSAASKIFKRTFVNNGLMPFFKARINWLIIELNKTGIGIGRGALGLSKLDYRNNLEKMATMTDKELGDGLEKFHNSRNAIAQGVGGIMFAAIVGVIAASVGDEDDEEEGFANNVDAFFKEVYKDKEDGKAASRWVVPLMFIYNSLRGNVKQKWKGETTADQISERIGGPALDSGPFSGWFKSMEINRDAATGTAQTIGGVVNWGDYYNWMNSYWDFFGDNETAKPKGFDNYASQKIIGEQDGDSPDDFDVSYRIFNGLMSGFLGYGLLQDIEDLKNED